MDDEGASDAAASALFQELREEALGIGGGQAMQVKLQLYLQVPALQLGEKALLYPRAGE
jgi:hypothetical protein